MLNKIAIIGAASLFAVSVASAQTSAPSGTAGGAVGTSKNQQERGTTGAAPKSMQGMTKGSTAPKRGHSSPDSTAGGATGTSKTGSERNPTPR
jgi:hypothetical protein